MSVTGLVSISIDDNFYLGGLFTFELRIVSLALNGKSIAADLCLYSFSDTSRYLSRRPDLETSEMENCHVSSSLSPSWPFHAFLWALH